VPGGGDGAAADPRGGAGTSLSTSPISSLACRSIPTITTGRRCSSLFCRTTTSGHCSHPSKTGSKIPTQTQIDTLGIGDYRASAWFTLVPERRTARRSATVPPMKTTHPRGCAAARSAGVAPIKIMSFICHSDRGDTTGHATTRGRIKPNEYRDAVTSGDTSQYEI